MKNYFSKAIKTGHSVLQKVKFEMNAYIALFLQTIINLEQFRYSYGRKFNQDRIRKTKIKLPFKNNKPDWNFMEEYIKSLPYSVNL